MHLADKLYLIQKQRSDRIARVGDFLSDELLPLTQIFGTNGIHLEIGCGHGHWLCELAQLRHNEIFIGVDLISKRISKANRKKQNLNQNNLFFIKAEAIEFLEALPDDFFLKNIYLMHPDPWPKKRHHKKRILQEGSDFPCQ